MFGSHAVHRGLLSSSSLTPVMLKVPFEALTDGRRAKVNLNVGLTSFHLSFSLQHHLWPKSSC